jgi:hypothetical protein
MKQHPPFSFLEHTFFLKVWSHALYYIIFDYSNHFFSSLFFKEKKKSAIILPQKRDVCDSFYLNKFFSFLLSTNDVNGDLPIHEE